MKAILAKAWRRKPSELWLKDSGTWVERKRTCGIAAKETERRAGSRDDAEETTISFKWIAEHLEMGSWVHAANRIYDRPKGK
jgi:hypothetical protein